MKKSNRQVLHFEHFKHIYYRIVQEVLEDEENAAGYGNLLQTKTEDSAGALSKYIQSTAAWTSAGTYVTEQTDARGKTVTTETDPDKGVVTKVTDPDGQEVNSQYDTLRRLNWY